MSQIGQIGREMSVSLLTGAATASLFGVAPLAGLAVGGGAYVVTAACLCGMPDAKEGFLGTVAYSALQGSWMVTMAVIAKVACDFFKVTASFPVLLGIVASSIVMSHILPKFEEEERAAAGS